MLYEKIDITNADELLSPCVTEDIMKKAEMWLYSFASRLGVEAGDVQLSFLTEELLKAYALREVCFIKSYGSGGNAWQQTRAYERPNIDYYGQKLSHYEKLIRDLEAMITPADLTGKKGDYPSYRMVSLQRG